MRRLVFAAILAALAPAGAFGKTLLVYDAVAKPFSMVDEVEPVAILLSRYDAEPLRRSAGELDSGDAAASERVVVVGVGGMPVFKNSVLSEILKKPLLAVGAAAPLAEGKAAGVKSRPVTDGKLRFRGREWPVRVDPFYPVEAQGGTVLAEVADSGGAEPLGWGDGTRFGFAALPGTGRLADVFSDLLVDFFGRTERPARVFYLVEDFNPGSGTASVRRLADYLAHCKAPFAVSVQLREIPAGVEPVPRGEFMDALRHIQARGGVVLLRGKDSAADIEKLRSEGIEAAGFENAAGQAELPLQVGRVFYKPTPDSEPEPFAASTALKLPGGGTLFPENVRGGVDGQALEIVADHVRNIGLLRGGIAGVVIPAWMPFQSMRDIVDAARSAGVPAGDTQTFFKP